MVLESRPSEFHLSRTAHLSPSHRGPVPRVNPARGFTKAHFVWPRMGVLVLSQEWFSFFKGKREGEKKNQRQCYSDHMSLDHLLSGHLQEVC